MLKTALQEILLFLQKFRALLREYSSACAVLGLPPYMSADARGSPGWTQKLGWSADGCISLSAFGGTPS
jgi:elongator complex protein 4